MPLLGTLIAGLFSALFSIFGRFFVMEKALKMAAVASMLILLAALFASAMSCVNGACASSISQMSISHSNFAVGLGIVFNTTTLTAVTCYMSCWILCQLYIIKKRMISVLV